jgi:hypothetical protein
MTGTDTSVLPDLSQFDDASLVGSYAGHCVYILQTGRLKLFDLPELIAVRREILDRGLFAQYLEAFAHAWEARHEG